MDETHHLRAQREAKLDAFRKLGIDPYVHRFPTTTVLSALVRKFEGRAAEELEDQKENPQVVAGRLMGKRRQGGISFGDLRDGTGGVQIVAEKNVLGEAGYTFFQKLDVGDFVGVKGEVFKTRAGELSVRVRELTLLSKSLRPLPEKWHGLRDVETRYRQRYLDLVMNREVKEVFRKRTRIVQALRDGLNARDFLEVETPMMQPIVGGATARPFVTHHHTFDMPLYLRVAPELYLKRLIVGGFDRVYEMNRSFRNEGISTEHNPEFTMLEFYMAYADYQDMMDLVEALLVETAQTVLGSLHLPWCGETLDLTPPWRRLSLMEALETFGGISPREAAQEDSARAFALAHEVQISPQDSRAKILHQILETRVEPALLQPTFLFDYPLEISPLAKSKPDERETVERFELFIGGKEIANAYTELNDPVDQRARFEEQVGLREGGDPEAQMMDLDYLRALEYGMPPTAGAGIGVDRLVMILTQSPSIRDVILFPQLRREGALGDGHKEG